MKLIEKLQLLIFVIALPILLVLVYNESVLQKQCKDAGGYYFSRSKICLKGDVLIK